MADQRQVLTTLASLRTATLDAGQNVADRAEKPITTLRPFGVALATLAVLGWIGVFSLGLLIDSSPYRAQLRSGVGGMLALSGAFVVATVTYTVTNIAALGCLAGLVGAIGRTAGLEIGGSGEALTDKTHPFLSGALRGFVVYLTVLSGILILFENPFDDPTLNQYIRLAGLVSILSFVVSYDPRLFGLFLTKVGTFIQGNNGPASITERTVGMAHVESTRSIRSDEEGR